MKTENVIDFRDNTGKDKILKIVCDNQHIFYDRVSHNTPIIWDDAKEQFTACRANQDPYMQQQYPVETVSVDYDQIQFMHCYDSIASALGVAEAKGLDETHIGYLRKFLSELASNRRGK